MDTGSIVVILGVLILILGVTLMRKGSAGADAEPPDFEDDTPDVDFQ